MEAQITKGPSSKQETSRTAQIFGGIVVAILVLPFLMQYVGIEIDLSLLPHFATATKQVAFQITSFTVDTFRTLLTALSN